MLPLIASIGLEWLLYFASPLWRKRRYYVALPVVLTGAGTGILLSSGLNVWCLLVAYVSIFRVVNHLRIAEGRMHEWYLRHKTKRSGLILGILQLLLLVGLEYMQPMQINLLGVLAVVQLCASAGILLITGRNIIKTTHQPELEHFADRELPTVTVAIPARNETEALEDCLRSIIANNYPKFEVLVLDDCSHDKTPEIIKQFAQDGVRFIKGAPPSGKWLAKNQAYDKLATEANGDLLLFCGVDVRFGPETIRALVTSMLARNKKMMSVMPRRLTSDVRTAFIQPMRYWWELALPRRYFNRPSVLSTCWLIEKDSLIGLGGFSAVQHAILPEGYFARELVKSDGYGFVRADDVLDVQTRKDVPEQRETAIRMRYPQLRRRLELVMMLVFVEMILLMGPFVIVVLGMFGAFSAVQISAAVSVALLVLSHVLIVQVSNPANVIIALFNFPAVVATELVLGIASMYKYEFSTVDWKGRNVCLPVMHTISPKEFADQTKAVYK